LYYWATLPPDAGVAAGVQPLDPLDTDNRNDSKRREPDILEIFDNLSPTPTSADYYERRVNGVSRLVTLARAGTAGPTDRPDNRGVVTVSSQDSLDARLGGGAGGIAAPVLNDYKGTTSTGSKTGLAAFEDVDEIAIVGIPDEADAALTGVTSELIDHCEKLKDRFAVTTALTGTRTSPSSLRRIRDTKYAAVYYPSIRIIDPLSGATKLLPPTGHVMGIYARSDVERGVHKAPANEVVRGAVDLEFDIAKGEQDILNPRGVNVIRSFIGRGIRVWGARTMSSDSSWKYINVRRLFIFLEESIDEATQYAVFEPNDTSLWENLRGSVTAFLTTQWRNSALQGTTAAQAFFVKVGLGETMTQDDIDNGRVIMLIGVAPVKPAEFVIFRIAQLPRGSEVSE
jgi:phage tail sheath protein FI